MGNIKVNRSNIISNYLEKYIKDRMPNIVYISEEFSVDSFSCVNSQERSELAADVIKVSNDFNLPIIGIGLRMRKENYREMSLIDLDREFVIELKDDKVYCKILRYRRGSSNYLYLIDTDYEKNKPEYRDLSNDIKGKRNIRNKIIKEAILGIGSIKVIHELGLDVDIYHFNGEYAYFSTLYLIDELSKKGLDYNEALRVIKTKCVLTIHSNINEIPTYSLEVLKEILSDRFISKIGYKSDEINIIRLLIDLFKGVNGVSIMHSRYLSKKLKLDKKRGITYVTNGIHIPTWIDESMIRAIRDNDRFLDGRKKLKGKLIQYIYAKTRVRLKEDVLLIGFCGIIREFKRMDLFLIKLDELNELLDEGKIQIVFSVKEHCDEANGKEIVNRFKEIQSRYPRNVVFIEEYSMKTQKELVKGVDLWINCAQKPIEPCNITQIKASMNGVLNLSTMSGCWPEVCVEGINGWQIGSGVVADRKVEQDRHDVESLYDVLSTKIIPAYYENEDKWNDMILQSIKSTIEYFNIERMIIEYYDKLYKK